MSHLTRKEMKKNELATAVRSTVDYAEHHSRGLLIALGGLVALALVGLGAWLFLGSRAEAASEQLARAMELYAAPIDPAAPKPNDPKAPSFGTEAARRARAKAAFQEVRDDHRWSDAADVAGLFLADIAVAEGRLAEARKLWEDFLDEHDDHVLAGETRVNLIALDRSQGKGNEVVIALRAMLEDPEPPLPQDVILYELAQTLEQLGRTPEATQSYQRILDEHPRSPYRQLAQQKVPATTGPSFTLGT
ncbi:MAG TPA: tetratricopeptide repeat protein [Thermoanaerobaculia bacterium]|nr:tetratricopeptide repeat protein [Thermoanaerobaculia bacterium]